MLSPSVHFRLRIPSGGDRKCTLDASRLGLDSADQSKVSYIFDPNTLLPLEDSVFDENGKVVVQSTVLSLTTAATAPADPYTS